jgi:hypothetical protein
MVQPSIANWDSESSMVQPNLVVRLIMVQPSIPNWDSESSLSPAKYTQLGF